MLFGTAYVPRVLQVANYDVPTDVMNNSDLPSELKYLRVLSRLSTLLLHDTAQISEDDGQPLENDPGPFAFQEGTAGWSVRHRYIRMQHRELPFSSFYLHPERDILWLSHETDLETLTELKLYYGLNLRYVRNVIIEETEWDDLDDALEWVEHFPGVRAIYVWLDSYRFQPGVAVTSRQAYAKRAQKFRDRDQSILQGRDFTVEYIDYQGNVYDCLRPDLEV